VNALSMQSFYRYAVVGLIFSVFTLAEFIAPSASWAAALNLEASQNRISVGESLQLVIRFEGLDRDDFPPVKLPAGLSVVGESSQSSFQMINGQTSAETQLILTVQAEKEGVYTIGPFEMKDSGQSYRTESMTLTVTPARVSGQSLVPGSSGLSTADDGAGQDEAPFVVRQALSREKIFVGQWAFLQIDLENFTSGPQIDYKQLQVPDTEGLRIEDVGKPQSLSRVENGRRISTVRVLKRITPLAAGTFSIPGARATADMLIPVRGTGRSLFDSMFGNVERRRFVLESEPLALSVEPLPSEGQPTGFSGVVGSTLWTVDFPLDPAIGMKTGDSLTLTVTVESDGELSGLTISPPVAPDLLKIYEDNPRSQTIARGGKILQVKEWKFALVPTAPGSVQLGPLQLNYFDPESESYKVLSHEFPAFTVTGDASSPLIAGGATQGGASQQVSRADSIPPERKGVDIYPIRTDLRKDFAPGSFEAGRHMWYLIFPILGLILLLLAFFMPRARTLVLGVQNRRRGRGALHHARLQIEKAMAGPSPEGASPPADNRSGLTVNPDMRQLQPPAAVLAAVKEYLGTKLSVQLSQKTAVELGSILESALHDASRIDGFTRGLQELEQFLYLPTDSLGTNASSGVDAHFKMRCRSLLEDLEWIDRALIRKKTGRLK
jgi:hypothetical protein